MNLRNYFYINTDNSISYNLVGNNLVGNNLVGYNLKTF